MQPRYVYHATEERRLVTTEAELLELGPEWVDSPKKAIAQPKPAPKPKAKK